MAGPSSVVGAAGANVAAAAATDEEEATEEGEPEKSDDDDEAAMPPPLPPFGEAGTVEAAIFVAKVVVECLGITRSAFGSPEDDSGGQGRAADDDESFGVGVGSARAEEEEENISVVAFGVAAPLAPAPFRPGCRMDFDGTRIPQARSAPNEAREARAGSRERVEFGLATTLG